MSNGVKRDRALQNGERIPFIRASKIVTFTHMLDKSELGDPRQASGAKSNGRRAVRIMLGPVQCQTALRICRSEYQ